MLKSLQNEQVKYVVNLNRRKFREDTEEFLIEGWRFVEEATRRGAEIKRVYLQPERTTSWEGLVRALKLKGVPIVEVDEKVMRKMSDTEKPQGILAIVNQSRAKLQEFSFENQPLLLVLDGIQDPGNCGTILRTALAAGIKNVCLTEGTVDLYNPKVLRSTMGTIFSLNIATSCVPEEIIAFCKDKELNLVIGDIEGDDLYSVNLTHPLALVVGNEGNGISIPFRNSAVKRICIPMSNEVESLNVAMATGIILYEIVRQRNIQM